jgi:hypothetical protein
MNLFMIPKNNEFDKSVFAWSLKQLSREMRYNQE